MFNFALMEYELEESIRRSQRPDTQVEAFLAQLADEKRSVSLRRRIAGLVMRFALRLDPEAVAIAPRQFTLEAASVRD